MCCSQSSSPPAASHSIIKMLSNTQPSCSVRLPAPPARSASASFRSLCLGFLSSRPRKGHPAFKPELPINVPFTSLLSSLCLGSSIILGCKTRMLQAFKGESEEATRFRNVRCQGSKPNCPRAAGDLECIQKQVKCCLSQEFHGGEASKTIRNQSHFNCLSTAMSQQLSAALTSSVRQHLTYTFEVTENNAVTTTFCFICLQGIFWLTSVSRLYDVS